MFINKKEYKELRARLFNLEEDNRTLKATKEMLLYRLEDVETMCRLPRLTEKDFTSIDVETVVINTPHGGYSARENIVQITAYSPIDHGGKVICLGKVLERQPIVELNQKEYIYENRRY